jgi:hypothetical protein
MLAWRDFKNLGIGNLEIGIWDWEFWGLRPDKKEQVRKGASGPYTKLSKQELSAPPQGCHLKNLTRVAAKRLRGRLALLT